MTWQFRAPVPNRSLWPAVVAGFLLTIPMYGQSTVLTWTKLPGAALDLGVAPSLAAPKATADTDSAWAVGTTASGANFKLYNWIPTDYNPWREAASGGVGQRIAVDSNSIPWAATDTGLYRWNFGPFKWESMLPPAANDPANGPVYDVATGADGSVWVIAKSVVGGASAAIRRASPTALSTPPFFNTAMGVPQKITVHPTGVPAVVTDRGTVYHLYNNAWTLFPGTLQDISHGADGSLWGVGPGPDNALFFHDGTTWLKEGTSGVMAVSVRNASEDWVVKTNNEIWRGINSASQTFTSYTNAVTGITAKLGQMTDAGSSRSPSGATRRDHARSSSIRAFSSTWTGSSGPPRSRSTMGPRYGLMSLGPRTVSTR